MMRGLTPVLVVTTVAALAPSASYAGAAPRADGGLAAPDSIAALGDSITRGFNACGWYLDCTSRSWAAGDHASVRSHYSRILATNPDIAGHNYNLAKSGADSRDLARQAAEAVTRKPDYVTILIGANDACAERESNMPRPALFRRRVEQGLDVLRAGVPNARIFVSSIPDLRRLWQVGRKDGRARAFWKLGRICPTMLANANSDAPADRARRERVRKRVMAYNAQLAAACEAYGPRCRHDGGEVFSYPFTLAQLSPWDYFHPNAQGQRLLAERTYRHGFPWTDTRA
ncbi:GDSL-type esterase/lipase family protein [Bailinhaonella thermotolerans]|uniref:SGNH/GDSL hydrolase family protein n=1 Tax=Bailinhaonella thermotolerans TaxID=1070861 RepID=A0A3A4AKV8_9ACTN|nr:SGNH/GDSL hydrolase family protein [Bailinhaonella thermotolerans]RJL27147.1 SGNH/GDSL hydrolase family protein [Bailinhaonella thermotolerans]